jgi:putative Mg2+ transporter-C (MgtC) family protein
MITSTTVTIAPLGSLLLALVLGTCLGIERTFVGKIAGMRTYALVSMGSCLFVLIAQMVTGTPGGDQLHLAQGVVTGLGFLCGGVIIFKDSQISGLTTAAGLWVAAAIGMASGYGFFALAIFATIATLFVFTILLVIEHVMVNLENRKKNGK